MSKQMSKRRKYSLAGTWSEKEKQKDKQKEKEEEKRK